MASATATESSRASFRASWIDWLTDRLARLPVPSFVPYLVIGLVAYGALAVFLWAGGSVSVERALVAAAPLAVALGGWLWLAGRFNAGARQAMAGLGAHRLRDPARFDLLERQLTTLPFLPTLFAGIVIAVLAVVRIQLSPGLLATWSGVTGAGLSIPLAIVFGVLAFVGAAYALKILVQSWRIHHLLRNEVKVDLFDVAPLYGFSRLTAVMAISVILSLLIFVLPVPGAIADLVGFLGSFVPLGLAALAFMYPLTGVHGRLVDDKERLLGITRESIRVAGASLREAVDKDDLPRMDPLQKALSGLEVEQRILDAQPTWPWQPETFRWVVGALMFPVTLYLLQLIIQRLVPVAAP